MTEIERKALELTHKGTYLEVNVENMSAIAEAYRNLHERHEAFRQEVSDAVTAFNEFGFYIDDRLGRFIITKPDPLVEAMRYITAFDDAKAAEQLRAELAKRGLEIREKSDG